MGKSAVGATKTAAHPLNRTMRTTHERAATRKRTVGSRDQLLRANSKLTAAEYSMPVLGLTSSRHADNRFKAYLPAIER